MHKSDSREDEKVYHLKLLTSGELDCGKTCFIKRYCEQRFESKYVPTIGIDYGVKKLRTAGVILGVF